MQKGADGNDGVARLDAAGSGFDRQGIGDEVVVAVDEGDFCLAVAEAALQLLSAVRAGIACADDDDPGCARGRGIGRIRLHGLNGKRCEGDEPPKASEAASASASEAWRQYAL